MDNFEVIYKILRYLQASMDAEIPDMSEISAERLKISDARWQRLLMLLQREGLIAGLSITEPTNGQWYPHLSSARPTITLRGMQYLAQNGMMGKAKELLKMAGELIP